MASAPDIAVSRDGEQPPATRFGAAARKGFRGRARQIFRQIGPWRLAGTFLFLLLALFVARFSWDGVPLTGDVERMLYDYRSTATREKVEQDDRVTMVVFSDQTLIATKVRSPLDRATLAVALANLDKLNPKAIGIDILIDQATDNDAQLIDAFKAMKTPTYLAFAELDTNPDNIIYEQVEFLKAFQQTIFGEKVRPASVLFETDLSDDVIRSWPNQPKNLPPLLSLAMARVHPEFRQYQGAIRFRAPVDPSRPVFSKLDISAFANPDFPVEALRPQIEGRYILIGGDIIDNDEFLIPAVRTGASKMKGLEVHAHMLSQLLDGARYRPIPSWMLWAAAFAVVIAGGLTAMSDLRPWAVGLILLIQLAIIAVVPYWLQERHIDTQQLPVFGWGLGWALAFAAVGTATRAVNSQQRRFAHNALGKYLPRDVANLIMRDPDRLALHGEKREIYALFTDLEGFTKLSHAISTDMVAFLLNKYLDVLSDVVLKHGGTIDKFVGDAVVAFWGAPIARPDDADRAVLAAIDMYEAGERFRREAPEGVPPIGCTRVGLHRGEAVVGNFGGEGRIQYTALGDSMNLAARLEGANKQLKTRALISETVVEKSTLVCFRPMGRVAVRGRSTPIAVYEPVPMLPQEDVTLFTALLRRFDNGDVTALEELEQHRAAHPEDAALENLVYRLRQVGPGGSFVLE